MALLSLTKVKTVVVVSFFFPIMILYKDYFCWLTFQVVFDHRLSKED